jgi:hypothetical protein
MLTRNRDSRLRLDDRQLSIVTRIRTHAERRLGAGCQLWIFANGCAQIVLFGASALQGWRPAARFQAGNVSRLSIGACGLGCRWLTAGS